MAQKVHPVVKVPLSAQVSPAQEVKEQVWRVYSPHAPNGTHLDILATKPIIDEQGMLAFGDKDNNLLALFAPGMWTLLFPLERTKDREVIQ